MRADLSAQIDVARRAVKDAVRGMPPNPYSHAFLWGIVTVKLKNGKAKTYRSYLGSVCTVDLDEAVRRAEQVPGVSEVYYKLD